MSCGTQLVGPVCHACGEHVPRPHDLRLRSFVAESMDVLDTRVLPTFRALVTRPGRLTAAYVAGRRRAFLTPIQTFLTANVIFFIAAGTGLPVVTLTTPLDVHVRDGTYGAWAEDLVRSRLDLRDVSAAELSETPEYRQLRTHFDINARHAATTLIIVFVPLFALALALMRVGRREPSGQHLAFAMHYVAFALLLFVAASVTIAVVRAVIGYGSVAGNSLIIPIVVLSALALYLVGAFRAAYRTGWAAAVLQAVVLAFLFWPLLLCYRLLLFLLVLFTI